jgi:hypothetical protein
LIRIFFADFFQVPTIYEEAINYQRKEDQVKGKDEIDKEFN